MAYNPDHNSTGTTSPDSLPWPVFADTLLKSISQLDKATVEDLFSKHKTAVKTVLHFKADLQALFVFYCLDKMVHEGRKISAVTLLVECENLCDVVPENVLLQVINNRGHFTVSSLDARSNSKPSTPNVRDVEDTVCRLSHEALQHDALQSSSGYGGRIFTGQKNRTLKNSVSTHNVKGENCVDNLDSAHAQNRLNYEDEVDRISISPLSNHPNFENEAIDSGKAGVKGQYIGVGLPSREHDHSMKKQITNTENCLFQLDESCPLDPRECLMVVTKENAILETNLRCVMCKMRPRGTTFLPCGHFLVCAPCSEDVYECSVCHTRVLGEIATFTVSHIDRTP